MTFKAGGSRWTGSAADALTTVAVLGGLILVPVLGWQNARLRKQQTAGATAALEHVDETLRRAIELSAIEGTRLPEALIQRIQASIEKNGGGSNREFLIIAFMPTVCGACLRAGLESLRRDGWWQEADISLHALVGEQSRSDRVGALALREAGLLPFPVTFVPTGELFGLLFRHMEGEFAQEPLYLRLGSDFRVLTAFQADQRNPALLDRWLAAIDQ